MHMSSQSVSSSQDYPWAQQKGHEIISALYTAYSRTVAFVKSFMVKINWGRKAKCSSTIACYGIIKRAKNLFVSSSCGIFEILMWIFESESNACNRSVSLYFNCDCIVLWLHVLWTAHCKSLPKTSQTYTLWIINGGWDSNVNFFWFIRVTSCF